MPAAVAIQINRLYVGESAVLEARFFTKGQELWQFEYFLAAWAIGMPNAVCLLYHRGELVTASDGRMNIDIEVSFDANASRNNLLLTYHWLPLCTT